MKLIQLQVYLSCPKISQLSRSSTQDIVVDHVVALAAAGGIIAVALVGDIATIATAVNVALRSATEGILVTFRLRVRIIMNKLFTKFIIIEKRIVW